MKVTKPLLKPPTLQNSQKGSTLEKLDEDIQQVNALKQGLAASEERSSGVDVALVGKPNASSRTSLDKGHAVVLEYSIPHQNLGLWSEQLATCDKDAFRQYELAADRVRDFYAEQHTNQTVAYNIQARINFKTKTRAKMSIWEALCKLNSLLDESDPDTELSQIDHAFQTAEAIRADGKPRWMQLVGLIHDLGKLLYFYDSKGQWDVVGDTFPVGCGYSSSIIFPESFSKNPDARNPLYRTKYGIYHERCGLKNVMLSWGHDEYMYHVAKLHSTLPKEALAMIRYHSFYPWHLEKAYSYLMDEEDKEMLPHVVDFNKYDLYSKRDHINDPKDLEVYYKALIDEYFPQKVVEF